MSHENPSELPRGIRSSHTLAADGLRILAAAWSPDGRELALALEDATVAVWTIKSGEKRRTFRGHTDAVLSLAWSPDGHTLASAARNNSISFWDAATGHCDRFPLTLGGANYRLGWSADGKVTALVCGEHNLSLWDAHNGRRQRVLDRPLAFDATAWSPDGRTLALGLKDSTIRLLDTRTDKRDRTLKGHNGAISSLAWSPDGRTLVSGSLDHTVRFWDVEKRQQTSILEGHTGTVAGLSLSSDGRLLASRGREGILRLWSCETLEPVAVWRLATASQDLLGLTFHPREPLLAAFGNGDTLVRLWELDPDALLGRHPVSASVHYTNAKVVLLGDTGVGKTGLGLVLSGHPFSPTESTHGRHVWLFDARQEPLEGGRVEVRETLLWDLAGQPGYRLIHQLHLGEVTVALVVLDARNEVDALAGVRHWARALRQSQRLQGSSALPLKTFLVAARSDRGGVGLSRGRVEELAAELGFDSYFETSAREGWGVAELAQAVRAAIEWSSLPRVSSTELFQAIKALLVEEKRAGRLLSTVQDLYRTFLRTTSAPVDSDELRQQFETCAGRVEARGLIRRLSFGHYVLLQPELLDAYASALINAARDEPDGLGSVAEEDVLAGRFRMPADERIPDPTQEKLLLLAMIEDLLQHELALREHAGDGPHLVFPSQLTREYPDLADPEGKALAFTFEGPLLNVYATLAVRLSHSGLFRRKELWKNAATYAAIVGGTCGMVLRELEEGKGELTLLFDRVASRETRMQFEDFVHSHLLRRALPESIVLRRILVCGVCGTPFSDLQVRRRRERGFDWIDCSVCGEGGVTLREREEAVPAPDPALDRAADAGRDFDAGLTSASGEMRTSDFRDWAGASRATVALVFTDIVASTRLATELGNEAMDQVRQTHFEQGRRWLRKHGGYEIKTIGDSLMVAFRTAVDAVDFALEFARQTGHERVAVRAGIHVGQIHIKEGDAFGSMVNYAARVVNQARGAEVWLSDRARDDVIEEKAKAHESLRWEQHPGCELKGFPGTYTLWSVLI